MNQKELSNQISEEFNLSKAESERILKYILNEISQELLSDQRVCFHRFGTFHRFLRAPKKYRNIKTGKIETSPAYFDIKFNPSKSLLKKLNK